MAEVSRRERVFDIGILRAYKNGVMIESVAAKVSIKGKWAALGRHWWRGDGAGAGTSTRFQGAIDDVRIYNRALSSQQMKMLKSAGDP